MEKDGLSCCAPAHIVHLSKEAVTTTNVHSEICEGSDNTVFLSPSQQASKTVQFHLSV